MFGPVLAAYMILSFHCALNLAQGLEGARSELQGANLPEDVMRREANCVFNEKMQTHKERRQAYSAAHRAEKERVRITPLNLGPSMRRKRRGEITLPPLHIAPPPISDITSYRWGLRSMSVSRNEPELGPGGGPTHLSNSTSHR
jgi:hypothetical protein